jgi:poly(3-hydroxybutyrate) depolymerase
LCVNLPADRQAHWLQPGVGHYGVFNGSRFRAEIAPRIAEFILSMGHGPRIKGNGFAARQIGDAAAAQPGNGAARTRARV